MLTPAGCPGACAVTAPDGLTGGNSSCLWTTKAVTPTCPCSKPKKSFCPWTTSRVRSPLGPTSVPTTRAALTAALAPSLEVRSHVSSGHQHRSRRGPRPFRRSPQQLARERPAAAHARSLDAPARPRGWGRPRVDARRCCRQARRLQGSSQGGRDHQMHGVQDDALGQTWHTILVSTTAETGGGSPVACR